MNWVNVMNRIDQINIMIEENNKYFNSVVGNEYFINDSRDVVKIIKFDKSTYMFQLESEELHKIWWDGVYDVLRNIIAKQYLYNV